MTAEPIKIHPFDMYVMLRDNPTFGVIEKGVMPIERKNIPEPYTVNDALVEIDGKLYCETTTVPPITKEFE